MVTYDFWQISNNDPDLPFEQRPAAFVDFGLSAACRPSADVSSVSQRIADIVTYIGRRSLYGSQLPCFLICAGSPCRDTFAKSIGCKKCAFLFWSIPLDRIGDRLSRLFHAPDDLHRRMIQA